jgi:hypothetical protein
MLFDSPVMAWGADFSFPGGPPDGFPLFGQGVQLHLFPGAPVAETFFVSPDVAGGFEFFGFVSSTPISHILFEAPPFLAGTDRSDFGIDNVVGVPEAGDTSFLFGVAVAALLIARRWIIAT